MNKKVLKLIASFGLLVMVLAVAVTLWSAPTAEAKKNRPRCGGLAGLECPSPKQTCIDDPTDSCDPKLGHTDCVGICVGPGGGPNG